MKSTKLKLTAMSTFALSRAVALTATELSQVSGGLPFPLPPIRPPVNS